MLRRLSIRRWGVLALCAVVFGWSWLPLLADSSFGVGIIVPAGASLAVAAFALWMPPLRQTKGWRKGMWMAAIAVACVVVMLGGLISALMAHASTASPREGATVIVLGAKIHGDRPSRMMRQRLDAAAERLAADPTAHCVVSGGLGPGETYTEAYVMKKYLVETWGIDGERIACEEYSTDSHENIHLSMDVIREKGWSTDVVIATHVFHQYRTRRLAFAAGADNVGGAACLTPTHLGLYYWVRECAAIFRLWLTNY